MKNFVCICIFLTVFGVNAYSSSIAEQGKLQQSVNEKLTYIGRYSVGAVNEDGGVAEIVVFNKDNNRIYMVNGALGSLDIVDTVALRSGKFTELALTKRIDVSTMGEANGFEYGDLTSVAVSTKNKLIVLAVQHSSYSEPGFIVLVNYDGEYIRHYRAGVQPDMICFTPDEQYILTADEGEPRQGYSAGAIDPPGSVTIVNVSTNDVRVVGFNAFDTASAKTAFLRNGGILGKGANPSLDFEPEYIAVSSDSRTAWVSLQEANALAVLDIVNGTFTSVLGLGYKDHNLSQNSMDALRNGKAELATQNIYGVYMPDGIAAVTIQGKPYILTANEGDAREWGKGATAYADITTFNIEGARITVLDNTKKDGLEADKKYILGARSFSIWDVSGGSAKLIYDSGNEFETRTAEYFPANFNASHTNNDLDSRSGGKGPEPEYVTTLQIGSRTYAIIGLERIGGIMVYDITNPQSPEFYDYINTRDFSGSGLAQMGDLGPEGISTVSASDSPTKKPLIFVANEVSGTIAVFEAR